MATAAPGRHNARAMRPRRRRRRPPGGSSPRKTMQLCSQVRRALELTLAGDVHDEVLMDLAVERVEPAPDDRRLRVVVVPHGAAATLPEADLRARLEAVRGLLLEEVARVVTRRKLPELAFEVVYGSLPEPGLEHLGEPPTDRGEPGENSF